MNCSIPAWIGQFLACMGGCFGCCTKPTPIIAVDEPSKGLRIQGFTVKNAGVSDGFWSTSTCDLEKSAAQSQISISSTSISNQTLCQSSSVGGVSNNPDFVNHGLLLWHESRRHWIESNGSLESQTLQRKQPRLSSWNTTYEGLIGSRNPFPKPIPLSFYWSQKMHTQTQVKSINKATYKIFHARPLAQTISRLRKNTQLENPFKPKILENS